MTQPSRVFLYAELQLSAPFTKDLWTEIKLCIPYRVCEAKPG